MDYEKKYKALVESVKTLKEANPSDDGIQNWVKDNVPELAKSKDEKISKEIIKYLEQTVPHHHRDEILKSKEWITWLERQVYKSDIGISSTTMKKLEVSLNNALAAETCESWNKFLDKTKYVPKMITPEESLGIDSDTWNKIMDECIYGEQNPNPVLDIEIPFGAKDSELQEASYYIPEGFHAEIEGNKVVIKKGENSVDKEFNEAVSKKIRNMVSRFFSGNGGITSKDFADQFATELLTLARNEILKREKWSEEDEEALEVAIVALEDMYSEDSPLDCYAGHHIPFDKAANQLKSLKERCTWKPSDEQMNTLEYYMHTLVCSEHKEVLFGLYADLKKLREG